MSHCDVDCRILKFLRLEYRIDNLTILTILIHHYYSCSILFATTSNFWSTQEALLATRPSQVLGHAEMIISARSARTI